MDAKTRVLISLDQAAKVSGFAIFEDEKLVRSGTFSIPPHKPIEERLARFYQELTDLYYDYADCDNIEFAFEDIQLQAGNVKTYKVLAYVQAVLLLFCFYNKIPYTVSTPSHWRKLLGGSFGRKREEQKQHAIEYVKDVCGKDVSSDEADAVCIGLARIKEKKEDQAGFQA